MSILLLAALFRLVEWIPRVATDAAAMPIEAASVIAISILIALPSLATFRERVRRRFFESSPRVFHAALFSATAIAAAVASRFAFDGVPFLDDDVATLFQARIFARGAITLPVPAEPQFFTVFGVLGPKLGVDHWCGMYPPGWPALLTLGVLVGAPWLVNPILAGALAVVGAHLGETLFDRATGRLAGLFLAVSPLVLGLAATHLSHVATALFAALALAALVRLLRADDPIAGLAAGVALGMAFLCRPLDAVLLGGVFAAPLLFSPQLLRERALGVVLGIAAVLVAAAILAAFQATTTGDPMLPGHKLGMGRYGRFGFMPLWGDRVHDAARALEHTGLRVAALDRGSLGGLLPASSAILVAIALGRGERGKLLWLAATPSVLTFAYAFFWYFDLYVPGRYLSASLAMVAVAAARGFVLAADPARTRGSVPPLASSCAASAVVLWSLAIGVPSQFRLMLDRVGDVEPILSRVVEAYGIRNAVVFMDAIDVGRNDADFQNDFYATGFVRNTLDLRGAVVYARNLRAQNTKLLERYPGRDAYLYRYHRRERKALLYRLAPCPGGIALESVRPIEPSLLLADPLRTARPAACEQDAPRAS